MGLKPPPRELVMTAGQVTGCRGLWRGWARQPSCETTGLIDGVDEAETRTCQAQRGVVAVTVAGHMSGLGSLMLGVREVVLLVLLDWEVGPWNMGSGEGMT